MKKLMILLTAAMLLLSAGVCSSQKQVSPEKKAKQFVERIFHSINNQDLGALEKTSEDLGEYITALDEEQGQAFGEAFAKYIYEYSDMYDYGKEFADQFLAAFTQAMLSAAEE